MSRFFVDAAARPGPGSVLLGRKPDGTCRSGIYLKSPGRGDGLEELLEKEAAGIDLQLFEAHPVAAAEEIRGGLQAELRGWRQELAVRLREKFAGRFSLLEAAERSLQGGDAGREDIRLDLRHFAAADGQADTGYWERGIAVLSPATDPAALRRDLQYRWRRSLERQRNGYYLDEIGRLRQELLKELGGRLAAMEKIAEVAEELGLEPGLLWDRSTGLGGRTDLQTLKRWSEYLKNNRGVRRLCELLGRICHHGGSSRTCIADTPERNRPPACVRPAQSEVVGIVEEREVAHVLPQELALLSDPDTELLFYLKLAEGRLMGFDYSGSIRVRYERVREKRVTAQERMGLGPMVICVDTSRSMAGEPEVVAKALALALALTSIGQRRDCCLFAFSTGVREYDLAACNGLSQLMKFLLTSFHGGTDPGPVLARAVARMAGERYERADLLMVSDFIMPPFSKETALLMGQARKRNCRFFSLTIGACLPATQPDPPFDLAWQYDPHRMTVQQLHGVLSKVER